MKAFIAAVALTLPFAAAAQSAAKDAEPGHQARLYQRYCDKLRESPEAYAHFVHRMRLVTGLVATDFASHDGTAPAIATCRENAQKLAAAAPAREREPR